MGETLRATEGASSDVLQGRGKVRHTQLSQPKFLSQSSDFFDRNFVHTSVGFAYSLYGNHFII